MYDITDTPQDKQVVVDNDGMSQVAPVKEEEPVKKELAQSPQKAPTKKVVSSICNIEASITIIICIRG